MRLQRTNTLRGLTHWWFTSERRRNLVIFCVAIGMILGVWLLRGYWVNVNWKNLGYPGIFILSFIGSVAMVLPVPGLITLCGLSVILNPFAVGIVAGIGEAIGEVSGYAVGYGGKGIIENHAFYIRVRTWMEKRGTLIILGVSMVPNPFVDVVGIAAGAMHFPFTRFMISVLVGKCLKGLMVSYTCYYGLNLLPWVS